MSGIDNVETGAASNGTVRSTSMNSRTRTRGFARMDPERQREIARQGGRAAHEQGRAHRFTAEEARAAGRKGGETISQNRDHMSEIGRRGGSTVSQDRRHMAEIGRRGGTVSQSHPQMDSVDDTENQDGTGTMIFPAGGGGSIAAY